MPRKKQTHCKNGHEFSVDNTYVRPDGTQQCKSCRRQYRRQYYKANRERELGHARKYREANKEKCAKDHRKWCEDNREYYSERTKQYRQDNPEQCREAVRRWKKNHPEKVNAHIAKRRAIKLSSTLDLTNQEQYAINRLYELSDLLGPEWHVDHIVPLSKDGSHHPDNLQIILAVENLKKNDSLDYQPELYVRI